MKRVLYILLLILFTPVAAEVMLRIYNPIAPRIKGDRIVLPTQRDETWRNTEVFGLDSVIHVHRNSLGFRGAEPPVDLNRALSVVCIGGSTTECLFLSDGDDWPARLGDELLNTFPNTWVNNAGLDGHSTFGHLILLHDIVAPLKPRMVLFLVGVNDIGRDDLSEWDLDQMRAGPQPWWKELELYNIHRAWQRSRLAAERGLGHRQLDFSPTATMLDLDSAAMLKEVEAQGPLVLQFQQRLIALVEECRSNDILPVLITQPTLMGSGIDTITGCDLDRLKLGEGENGSLFRARLERYNDGTRAIAAGTNVLLIDLAREMPASSAYYYDAIHFNKQGAREVARLIAAHLIGYLGGHSPQHLPS